MKRWCGTLLLLSAFALPARAHFVWIVPDRGGKPEAQVVFSDDLQPDAKVPVTKIAKTELFVVTAGKATPLKATLGKDAYLVSVPGKGGSVVAGVCRYGVTQRGKAEPFLLTYHARALVGAGLKGSPEAFSQPTARLALDIVPIEDKPRARVLWQGKPLAGAEVALLPPGHETAIETTTDMEGTFKLEQPKEGGLYAIRARHVEAKGGEEGGKKYKESRHYATLVFAVTKAAGRGASRGAAVQPKVDPLATKLLRDARAARANWENFPGFSADLEVNHDGKVVHGRLHVAADGAVKVELPDAAAKAWAQRQLRSLVEHRLDTSAERDTPCAFADDNVAHPLGRAIRVLNDELHSGYRIRDRQILEVNRQMKDFRFTITVLENRLTPEKKHLPTSYIVNNWDLKAGALKSAQAFHQSWRRVGLV